MTNRRRVQAARLPSASISWIYLSDEDVRRAEDLIAAFKEDDAADSLGLRPLNDLFSDRFYPALTTPMTRARYFTLIPALFRHLDRSAHQSARHARQAAKALQLQLARRLGNEKGAYGKRSDEGLKRWPSSIYWSGLRKLRILTVAWSETAYYRHATTGTADVWISDDGTPQSEEPMTRWDADCPIPGGLKLTRHSTKAEPTSKLKLTLQLDRAEAEYLKRRFLRSASTEHCLLADRLRRSDSTQVAFSWQVKTTDADLKRWLRHAERLSAISRGLLLVYYALVYEARKEHANVETIQEEFRGWRRRMERTLRQWKFDEFGGLLADANHHSVSTDIEFLAAAHDIVLSGADKGRWNQLRALVKDRELARKRSKCRLCGRDEHKRYLKQWKRPQNEDPDYAFDFRQDIGQRVLTDILTGLRGSHA